MKRSIDRKRRLPVFQADVQEFEALWDALSKQFPESTRDTLYRSMTVDLQAESLSFRDWSEFRGYRHFPDRLKKFNLYMSQGDNTVRVRSEGYFVGSPVALAEGDSEAWCAGVLEVAYVFARAHGIWYGWVATFPFFALIFCVLGACVGVAMKLTLDALAKGRHPSVLQGIAWVAIVAAWSLLIFSPGRILPRAQLVVRDPDGWLKRNAWAIALAFTAIGAIASVVALLR